jgi:DNA-binding transcriptional ArsR family regulator
MTYAATLHALADPTRRAIFERLRAGPRPVGELAAGLPVSRPAVSQHLRVLREAALVVERREGTRNIYNIDPRGLEALRAYIEGFWDGVLGAFKQAAEAEAKEARGGSHAQSKRTRSPKKYQG